MKNLNNNVIKPALPEIRMLARMFGVKDMTVTGKHLISYHEYLGVRYIEKMTRIQYYGS